MTHTNRTKNRPNPPFWKWRIDGEASKAQQLMNRSKAVSMCIVSSILAMQSSLGAPSDFDPNFGQGGVITSNIIQSCAIDIQTDGKILAVPSPFQDVGERETSPSRPLSQVIRFDPDGKPDLSFGTSGIVKVGFGTNGKLNAIVVQNDGKIVVGGKASESPDLSDMISDFALARLNQNGTADLAFGNQGIVLQNVGLSGKFYSREDMVACVTIDSNNRICCCGWTGTSIAFEAGEVYDFALARLGSDGLPDQNYGISGCVRTGFGRFDEMFEATVDSAWSCAIQADGKQVVAGGSLDLLFSSTGRPVIARYSCDGTLDPAFGNNGVIVEETGADDGAAYAIAVQPDQKIVVAGSRNHKSFLARYLSSGERDPTFGVSGVANIDFGGTDCAYALALQPDGKIIFAGESIASSSRFAVARCRPDGTPDPGFGVGGKLTFSRGSGTNRATSLKLRPNGRIILGGSSGSQMAMIQLLGDSNATLPSITTGAWQDLEKSAVALTGSINPNGVTTAAHFEYGLTTAYGNILPVQLCPADGTTNQNVRAEVTNLLIGTPYHFRLVAENVAGTSYGDDQTFMTLTSLEDWRRIYFGDPGDAGGGADLRDFDGDGLTNLLEYAFGGNPKVADADSLCPVAVFPEGRPSIVFSCDYACSDITYTVQASATCGADTWIDIARSIGGARVDPIGTRSEVSDTATGKRNIRVTAGTGMLPANRGFLRIKVSK